MAAVVAEIMEQVLFGRDGEVGLRIFLHEDGDGAEGGAVVEEGGGEAGEGPVVRGGGEPGGDGGGVEGGGGAEEIGRGGIEEGEVERAGGPEGAAGEDCGTDDGDGAHGAEESGGAAHAEHPGAADLVGAFIVAGFEFGIELRGDGGGGFFSAEEGDAAFELFVRDDAGRRDAEDDAGVVREDDPCHEAHAAVARGAQQGGLHGAGFFSREDEAFGAPDEVIVARVASFGGLAECGENDGLVEKLRAFAGRELRADGEEFGIGFALLEFAFPFRGRLRRGLADGGVEAGDDRFGIGLRLGVAAAPVVGSGDLVGELQGHHCDWFGTGGRPGFRHGRDCDLPIFDEMEQRPASAGEDCEDDESRDGHGAPVEVGAMRESGFAEALAAFLRRLGGRGGSGAGHGGREFTLIFPRAVAGATGADFIEDGLGLVRAFGFMARIGIGQPVYPFGDERGDVGAGNGEGSIGIAAEHGAKSAPEVAEVIHHKGVGRGGCGAVCRPGLAGIQPVRAAAAAGEHDMAGGIHQQRGGADGGVAQALAVQRDESAEALLHDGNKDPHRRGGFGEEFPQRHLSGRVVFLGGPASVCLHAQSAQGGQRRQSGQSSEGGRHPCRAARGMERPAHPLAGGMWGHGGGAKFLWDGHGEKSG